VFLVSRGSRVRKKEESFGFRAHPTTMLSKMTAQMMAPSMWSLMANDRIAVITSTSVRELETCLSRIVQSDIPLAPSTLLAPFCCRRAAASAPVRPFLVTTCQTCTCRWAVCAHLMSVLRKPQIWLAPNTWAESAEKSAIDAVFVQTVDLSESGSAGWIDGGPLKPHIGGSVCPSTAVSSLPIHV
jgi:hypothetical protein